MAAWRGLLGHCGHSLTKGLTRSGGAHHATSSVPAARDQRRAASRPVHELLRLLSPDLPSIRKLIMFSSNRHDRVVIGQRTPATVHFADTPLVSERWAKKAFGALRVVWRSCTAAMSISPVLGDWTVRLVILAGGQPLFCLPSYRTDKKSITFLAYRCKEKESLKDLFLPIIAHYLYRLYSLKKGGSAMREYSVQSGSEWHGTKGWSKRS